MKRDWAWQDDAWCRGEDLALFFAPEGEREPDRSIREGEAQAICSGCPVRSECLEYALSRPERYGTWGGMSERQRAAERRRIQRRGLLRLESLTKHCSGCGVTKTTAEFGSDRLQKDGLNRWCKKCTNKAAKRRRDTKQAVAS